MTGLKLIFWVGTFVLFYCYAGYGLLLWMVGLFKQKRHPENVDGDWPGVTIVVASYNEENVLAQKIQNTLGLDYPPGKLKIIIVADGSTDRSLSILQTFTQITTLHQPDRRGKSAALNRAMQYVQTPFVIFTDANTILNELCIKKMMVHFTDKKVGAVAGEKKIVATQAGIGMAESWYWQYESFMKKRDADMGTLTGAAGELFAMRSSLYTPLEDDIILDDLMLSINVCIKGYKIAYEPLAFAMEKPSISLAEEQNRKVRIAAGAFQALRKLSFSTILNKPVLAFQLLSRRWLRWVICPAAIALVFLCNLLLAGMGAGAFYQVLFILQMILYVLAGVGWRLAVFNKALVLTSVPFYFLFMNYCMLKGMVQYYFHTTTVLWPKAQRQL